MNKKQHNKDSSSLTQNVFDLFVLLFLYVSAFCNAYNQNFVPTLIIRASCNATLGITVQQNN